MRANWKTVPISELYEGLFDGPHATPKPSDAGPVFLGIKNVTDDGHLDMSDIRHIAEEDFPIWTRRVEPKAGDIVFTYEATLNRYAIIPEGFRGCLGRRMALIRTNPQKTDSRFLFYYFFSPAWREIIKKNMMTGATVDRIPLITFPDFPVSVPPLPVQRRIAGILSAYDELMENSQRRIRLLEAMARALYREWFVHFRFPGHETHPRVASPLGDIPKGWEVASLESIHPEERSVVLTGPFGSKLHASDYREAGVPLLLVKHVRDGQVIEEDLPLVGEHKTPELNRYRLKTGDIVMTRVGYVGDSAFIYPRYDGWLFSGQTLRIRLPDTSRLNSRFLAHYLQMQAKPRIEKIAVGATRASLNTDLVASLEVLVPPLDLQKRFADVIQPVDSQKLSLREKIQNLRRTRDLLLPRLLSGQVELETN